MTIHNRFCPEASDIVAVQIECKHCHATISYPPDGWKPTTLKCPNCPATLVTALPEAKELMALGELSNALKILRSSSDLEFKLRLEFDWKDQ
jgi:hypothetical protein